MHEALAVQEPDPLHHIQGDLQPLSERQTSLVNPKKKRKEKETQSFRFVVLSQELTALSSDL